MDREDKVRLCVDFMSGAARDGLAGPFGLSREVFAAALVDDPAFAAAVTVVQQDLVIRKLEEISTMLRGGYEDVSPLAVGFLRDSS